MSIFTKTKFLSLSTLLKSKLLKPSLNWIVMSKTFAREIHLKLKFICTGKTLPPYCLKKQLIDLPYYRGSSTWNDITNSTLIFQILVILVSIRTMPSAGQLWALQRISNTTLRWTEVLLYPLQINSYRKADHVEVELLASLSSVGTLPPLSA